MPIIFFFRINYITNEIYMIIIFSLFVKYFKFKVCEKFNIYNTRAMIDGQLGPVNVDYL